MAVVNNNNDMLNEEELVKKIEEIRSKIIFLKRENKFLDRYCQEEDEEVALENDTHVENLEDGEVEVSDEDKISISGEMMTRGWSCSSNSNSSEVKLDIEKSFAPWDKYELIVRELKHLREDLREMYQKCNKLIYIEKLNLQEVKLRRKELIKDQKLFNEIIIANGVHPITRNIRSEFVEKYFHLSFKVKDLEIERSALSKHTLKNRIKKLIDLLKDEVYYPTKADCDKIKLENDELRAITVKKNKELIQNRNELHKILGNLKLFKQKLRKTEQEKNGTTQKRSKYFLTQK